MSRLSRLLRNTVEFIAAALFATMFSVFILQIFSRYILAQPFGWTLEVCLTLWVWIVFWGGSFIVRHKEHVIFDVLYHRVNEKMRRAFALLGAAIVAIFMGLSFLPTWDYIDFLQIENSPILKIPMRSVYSIYAVFIISVVVMYTYRFYSIARYGLPKGEEQAVYEEEGV